MDTLTNVGTAYDSIPASKGLPMIRVDFAGVTQVKLDVFVNKIGTGTQSWQLWNVTDGTQVGVIDDAGAAGDKTLSATFNVALSGEKVLRLRAKSSVTTDDPVFYSCSLLVR